MINNLPNPDSRLGSQFEVVYHSSFYQRPPHKWVAERPAEMVLDFGNASPFHFHAGTYKAAIDRTKPDQHSDHFPRREYLHAYVINKEQMHPVVYGDDEELSYPSDQENVREGMKKKGINQQGLFETVPLTRDVLEKSRDVIPYRNAGEDIGSVSYAIPKDRVEGVDVSVTPTVGYLGVSKIR